MPAMPTPQPQPTVPELTPAEGGRYLRNPQTGELLRQAPAGAQPPITEPEPLE